MPQNAPFCINGHEFTQENTYVRQDLPTPVRVCRTCVRQRSLARWERIKAGRYMEAAE
jgi:hypothetical protein